MPPRKPPKRLMETCMGVISNTLLDSIAELEAHWIQDENLIPNEKESNKEQSKKEKDGVEDIKTYNSQEAKLASYLLSKLPISLLSVLLSEVIREFTSRCCSLIKALELCTSVGNGVYRSSHAVSDTSSLQSPSIPSLPALLQGAFTATTFSNLRHFLDKIKGQNALKLPPSLTAVLRTLFVSHPSVERKTELAAESKDRTHSTNIITRLDFSGLVDIGPVTEGVFKTFKIGLSLCLQSHTMITHLILASRNSKNSLPQCTDEHLILIGKSCHELVYLDISFIRGLTGEGLKYLIPKYNHHEKHIEKYNVAVTKWITGCPKLVTLYIFDCGFFDRDVATVASCLPNLEYLGYKETGKVIKHIYKNMLAKTNEDRNSNKSGPTAENDNIVAKMENCWNKSDNIVDEKEQNVFDHQNGLKKLTHLNNLGSKTRRLIAAGLRFKKPLIEATMNVCPNVQNIKVRVTDQDVENLSCLDNLRTVEFMYNVGTIHSPGIGTASFLQNRGVNLTSVAFICSSVSMTTLKIVGENCPNLGEFWCRSNFFTLSSTGYYNMDDDSTLLPPEFAGEHRYFQKLKTLYFRVGEGELSIVYLPEYVLPYILRNASDLKELLIAVRSSTINHQYLTNVIQNCKLTKLEKLMVVVPGMNSLPNILNLNMNTVYFVIDFCPRLRKLGNLLSWTIEDERVLLNDFLEEISDSNFDIHIVNKKMVMR